MTIRTIIVDDEVWARKRLHVLLEDERDCVLVAECADGETAIRAIRGAAPDLLFLDVQMPDMSGCDVLDAVAPLRSPVVVFVTAYDRYAVEAFERDAVDYLLKPFDEIRFRAALSRARRELSTRDEHRSPTGASGTAGIGRRFLRRLAVQRHGRVFFVNADEVDSIEAAGNYVTVRVGTDAHLLRIGMTALERRLDPDQFVRIHRSSIVNWNRVREIRPWSRGEQMLVLCNGRALAIGRAYREGLAARLLVGRR
jgi:two-component system LytT family response regulator